MMAHRQRRQGRWSLAVLTAAGLLAVSGGIAVASPSFHHDRSGRGHHHHDGSSSSSTVLYVAPSATSGAGGTGAAGATGGTCSSSQPCTLAGAVAAAAAGDTILVEPGTYANLSGISIPDGITLLARGRVILTGSAPIFTLTAASPSGTPSSSPSSPPATGIVIRGFHFDQVGGPGSAITSTGASDVTILDNTFADGSASGIGLQGVSDSVVQGNVIANTGGGIALTGTATTTDANDEVLGNTISDVSSVGIEVGTEDGVLIQGNDVSNVGGSSSGAAIELASADQTNITIVGNNASRSYVGLSVGAGALGNGIVAIQNDFVDDTNAGVAYASSGSGGIPLNAMLDWWGCQGGPSTPSTSGGGTPSGGSSSTPPSSGCSPVTGNVDWTPAATEPVELPPAPPLPPGLAGDPAGNGPAKHAEHPGRHHGSSGNRGNGHGGNGKGHGKGRRGNRGS